VASGIKKKHLLRHGALREFRSRWISLLTFAVRSTGKNGKEEVTTEHMDLQRDLVNGVVLSIAKNILPDTPEAKVSMVVLAPSGNS
jgi:hypothetical protein